MDIKNDAAKLQEQEIDLAIPELLKYKKYMRAAYEDLQSKRKLYDKIDKAYYNPFPEEGELNYNDRSVNVLRSGFCHSGVEIAARGLRFPQFRIESSAETGVKQRNMISAAKALQEWLLKESGFANVYIISKEDWAKYGDTYRRPYARLIKSKGKKQRFWPQYQQLDPRYTLLDPDATQVWSENVADSATYYGYTQMYTEEQVIVRWGEDILDCLIEGALIDVDEYTSVTGKTKNTKYYECLEIVTKAEGYRFILLGAGGFPVYICMDGKSRPSFDSKYDSFVTFSNKFKTTNKLGEFDLDITNLYFYYDSRGPRNLGLVHKLIPAQHNDELLENLKTESTRLRMFEIPTVAGGKPQVIDESIANFVEGRRENLLEVLHAPGGVEGTIPKFDILRFNGIPAEEARSTTEDNYNFAKNLSGIDLSRMQVQANVTLGQSQLLEQESVDTLETIITRGKQSLQREYERILQDCLDYDGYGLDDVYITHDYEKELDGITPDAPKTIVTTKREISIEKLAKELKKYRFQIIIDDSSLVNRTYTTMLDSWIQLLGVLDPGAVPALYQFILQKIGEAGRFSIPPELFKGIENQQAKGGTSQFSSSSNAPQVPNETMPNEIPI